MWLVTFGVAAVLLFFFSVPIIFILYGGAGGVIGGAMILAPIIAVQYLVLVLFSPAVPKSSAIRQTMRSPRERCPRCILEPWQERLTTRCKGLPTKIGG